MPSRRIWWTALLVTFGSLSVLAYFDATSALVAFGGYVVVAATYIGLPPPTRQRLASAWRRRRRRGGPSGRALILVALLLGAGVPFAVLPASAATEYEASSITMTRGTVSGTLNLNQDDGATEIFTEGGTMRTGTQWLKPDADSTAGWENGGLQECLPGIDEFCHVDDDPIDDANTTYVSCDPPAAAQCASLYALDDFAAPSVLDSIDSLTEFVVARKNGTGPSGMQYSGLMMVYGVDPCNVLAVDLTQAYANYSNTPTCTFAFADTSIDGLEIYVLCTDNNIVPAEENCAATAVGVVVGYTYRNDFYLGWTAEFPGIPSDATNLRLQYECAATDESNAAAVTHLGVGVGSVACDGTTQELALQGDSGIATLTFATTPIAGDTTQSTLVFDVLILLADTTGGGDPPPGDEDVFEMRCFSEVSSLRCYVKIRDPVPPGVHLVSSYWTSPGEVRRVHVNATRHDVSLPFFQLTPINVTVTVSLIVSDGGTARLTTVVHVDSSWIVIALLAGFVLVVVVWSWHGTRKAEKEAAAKKKHETQYTAQYTKMREIMFGRGK